MRKHKCLYIRLTSHVTITMHPALWLRPPASKHDQFVMSWAGPLLTLHDLPASGEAQMYPGTSGTDDPSGKVQPPGWVENHHGTLQTPIGERRYIHWFLERTKPMHCKEWLSYRKKDKWNTAIYTEAERWRNIYFFIVILLVRYAIGTYI